jgi:Uma2 family endonuclease
MNFALANMPLPLRFRPETPMSDEDLMRFCAANECLNLECDSEGEISLSMKPGAASSRKTVAITAALDRWNEQDGRGVCFAHAGFTLPDGSMRSSDAAWIEAARWDALSEADKDRFAPICPDFIIERRSQSDDLAELETKMERWIANGARVAWLIDPERQVVAIYRPNDQPEVLHHPTSVQGNGIVAGFELVMARIWE